MIKKFIRGHISKILNGFEMELIKTKNSVALDNFLRSYFKQYKSLGSHDRSTIYENVYNLIRYKVFLDVISPKPLTWESRFDTLHSKNFENQKENTSLLPLFQILCDEFGQSKAFDYCNNMNERAPLTVRVNPFKIKREELFNKWSKVDQFPVRLTTYSPLGIVFTNYKNQNLFELPEFKRGYFEIQDEGSQIVGLRIKCKEGQKVLDYCAGAGGKTLTFAPYLKGTGKIYLHDSRKSILQEAKKRLKRAGVQNVEFHEDTSTLSKIKQSCHWVLLDVPCSGTGTLRRNPDLKLKFNQERLQHYVELQEGIINEAIQYIKKDEGKLVYTTCSILPQENIRQIAKICKQYNMEVIGGKHFQIFPEKGGMDCFFEATLQFKQ